MSTPLRILMVEDSEDDAKLALRALRKGGFDPTWRRVQSAAELEAALAQESWDAVISDFRMPGFTGLDALGIFHSTGLDIPFILISGTIGEATAVEAMKSGASDYIMKKSLARLAPALKRELKEAQARAAHRQDSDALRESDRRFSDLLGNVDMISVMLDTSARITYCNDYLLRVTGWRREEVIGRDWFELFIPPGIADLKAFFATILAGAIESRHHENEILTRTGERRLVRWNNSVLCSATGAVTGTASIGEDITERSEAETRIKRLNRVYAVLSGITTLIVRVRDRDELFNEACRIAIEEGGFHMAWVGIVDQGIGKVVPVVAVGPDADLLDAIKGRISSSASGVLGSNIAARAVGTKAAAVCNDLRSDPQIRLRKLHLDAGILSMVMLPLIVSNEAIGVFALYSQEAGFFDEKELKLLTELAGDIAFAIDHIEKQERLDYLAYYDALTRLANRTLFLERVAQYARGGSKDGHRLAVLIVDLEGFKDINDSLGQAAGDELLRQVAHWLTDTLGDANLLARVGADRFAVVLPDVDAEEIVVRVIEKMMDGFLEHPFRLNDAVFRVAAKIGVAIFPEGGADADALFRNAEAALKRAKAGGDRYLLYARNMHEMVAGRLTMENQLRQALDREEFVLHYQPKMNLTSGKLTGAEALLRWNDPRMGMVPPARFIPILEETGLIHAVGQWALRKAIDDAMRWLAMGLPAVRIAVNVSPRQLRHPGFMAQLGRDVAINPLASAALELELTESLIMADVKHSIASLHSIRALGVTVAIDDFGTGFSSLSYLARLPLDTLKIDQSFVADMTASQQGLALVATIVTLAHSLKLNVVAEGVETKEQSRLLRLLGCDEIQGHLFSKPVPAEVFERKFLAHQPLAAD